MIKLALALVLAAATLPFTSVQARSDVVTAEAPEVGPFNRVDIAGHAELVLVQGDREGVVIETSSRGQAKVRVRSQDGRLSIEVGESSSWLGWMGGGSREPTIIIYFKTLEALRTSGSLKITAAAIVSPALDINASGAASLRIDGLKVDSLRFSGAGAVKGEFAGTATEQDITISGAGTYRGSKLVSDTAKVSVSGAGKVSINARKNLDASISGAGAIEYFGDPVLRQRVSGAGKITRRAAITTT